jgi:hypothetical protein
MRPLAEYLNLAHEFLGKGPPPLTRPFSTSFFLRFAREDESIRDTVVAIGAARAAHQQPNRPSEESNLVDFLQRKLYVRIQARLQEPDPHLDPTLLPLALLLCILRV